MQSATLAFTNTKGTIITESEQQVKVKRQQPAYEKKMISFKLKNNVMVPNRTNYLHRLTEVEALAWTFQESPV